MGPLSFEVTTAVVHFRLMIVQPGHVTLFYCRPIFVVTSPDFDFRFFGAGADSVAGRTLIIYSPWGCASCIAGEQR
jgi:hypothetical protein